MQLRVKRFIFCILPVRVRPARSLPTKLNEFPLEGNLRLFQKWIVSPVLAQPGERAG